MTEAEVHVVVQADGGSRGNPGIAGCGAVVLSESGSLLSYDGLAIGIAPNNRAEYRGLILGLGKALELRATHVRAQMDSKLVVEQMSGRWRVKDPVLRSLHADATDLVAEFAEVIFEWIPREQNRAADLLANQAMSGRPITPPPMYAGPVTTHRAEPRGDSQGLKPAGQRTSVPVTERVRETAALATALGLEGEIAVVVRELLEQAPDELVKVWDRLPGYRWLSETAARFPLSWRQGCSSQGSPA